MRGICEDYGTDFRSLHIDYDEKWFPTFIQILKNFIHDHPYLVRYCVDEKCLQQEERWKLWQQRDHPDDLEQVPKNLLDCLISPPYTKCMYILLDDLNILCKRINLELMSDNVTLAGIVFFCNF